MKAKIMAIAAALILAITSFTACSNKKSDSSSKAGSENSIVSSDIDLSVKPVDYEVGYN